MKLAVDGVWYVEGRLIARVWAGVDSRQVQSAWIGGVAWTGVDRGAWTRVDRQVKGARVRGQAWTGVLGQAGEGGVDRRGQGGQNGHAGSHFCKQPDVPNTYCNRIERERVVYWFPNGR